MVDSLLDDSKNTIGSVPNDLLCRMLCFLGVPTHFVKMCRDIHSGSSQSIRYSKYSYTKYDRVNTVILLRTFPYK